MMQQLRRVGSVRKAVLSPIENYQSASPFVPPATLNARIANLAVARPVLLAGLKRYEAVQPHVAAVVSKNAPAPNLWLNKDNIAACLDHNVEALERVAKQPKRIVGLDKWLNFLARQKIGTQPQKLTYERATDVQRTFKELDEALYLARIYPGYKVEIGCDDAVERAAAPFDISLRDATGTVIRNVEVTSIDKKVRAYSDFTNALHHVNAKCYVNPPGAREVAVAVRWQEKSAPHAILKTVCEKLNSPDAVACRHPRRSLGNVDAETWRSAAGNLDTITVLNSEPESHVIYGILYNENGVWQLTLPQGPCCRT